MFIVHVHVHVFIVLHEYVDERLTRQAASIDGFVTLFTLTRKVHVTLRGVDGQTERVTHDALPVSRARLIQRQ